MFGICVHTVRVVLTGVRELYVGFDGEMPEIVCDGGIL